MKKNSIKKLNRLQEELPIEKEYREKIVKWLEQQICETGFSIERVVTEVFLQRMSIEKDCLLRRK